jgi:ribonuclease HI
MNTPVSEAVSRAPFTHEIVFDGGSLSNPGHGYGSYRLRGRDLPSRIERLDFGDGVTNNEAEYRALIGGLGDLLAVLERSGASPRDASVLVLGDSQLVLKQTAGLWKVKGANLQPLTRQARDLVARFGKVELRWQPRKASVAVLGH